MHIRMIDTMCVKSLPFYSGFGVRYLRGMGCNMLMRLPSVSMNET